MQVLGNLASKAFTAEPDVREWANQTTLNPGRIAPERLGDPLVTAALERYRAHAEAGMTRLTAFAGV